jgi:hypothetical protein
MLEMSPLTRLLPDTSDHISKFFNVEDDDGGVIVFSASTPIGNKLYDKAITN